MDRIVILLFIVCLKVTGLDGATKASKHLREYLHVSVYEDRPIYHERSGFTVSYKCQGKLSPSVCLSVKLQWDPLNSTSKYTKEFGPIKRGAQLRNMGPS